MRRQSDEVKRRLFQPKGAGGQLCGGSRFATKVRFRPAGSARAESHRRDALSGPPRGLSRGSAEGNLGSDARRSAKPVRRTGAPRSADARG